MKKILIFLCTISFLSCTEKGPFIDFGSKATDTSFMAPVETPQQRIVLIEEFTGVKCPNCPAGQVIIKSIEDENPGRIAVISIQPFNSGVTVPIDEPGIKTIHDNRSQAGTDLCNGIYGANNSLPSAGIDRASLNGSLLSSRLNWLAFANTRKVMPAEANVQVTSTYDASKKQATIKVHVAYTSPVAKSQLLTVALVENEVIDAQEFTPADSPSIVQNYRHQHVLRDILTITTGSTMLSDKPTKEAGQVYERTFVYTLPPTVLNPGNCRIIAYVSNTNGADKEVVQATEAHLTP